MRSLGLLWLANDGVPLQDSERIVLQKEILVGVVEDRMGPNGV